MRRISKTKIAVVRVAVRKSPAATVVAPTPPRRVYPAWIDANDRGVAAVPATVTPRVRDGLVLRVVGQKKNVHPRNPTHGSGAR